MTGGPFTVALGLILLLSTSVVGQPRAENTTRSEGTKKQDLDQPTNAIDVKVGEKYGSGTRVRIPMQGISFIIPQEWSGTMPQGSRALLLESKSKTKPGVGIVVMFQNVTLQELADQLNEPQALEEGFVLHPIGSAKQQGDRMIAAYHAGEYVGRVIAVLGPSHNAIAYLFTGPKAQAGYYDHLLEQLATTTQFMNVDPAEVITRWQELLAGMALKRLEQDSGPGAGSTVSTIWQLCRNNRFTFTHSSRIADQTPNGGRSSADEDRRQGQWRVEVKGTDAVLILTEDNGAVISHALAYDGEKVSLDEEPVLRVESKDCQS